MKPRGGRGWKKAGEQMAETEGAIEVSIGWKKGRSKEAYFGRKTQREKVDEKMSGGGLKKTIQQKEDKQR